MDDCKCTVGYADLLMDDAVRQQPMFLVDYRRSPQAELYERELPKIADAPAVTLKIDGLVFKVATPTWRVEHETKEKNKLTFSVLSRVHGEWELCVVTPKAALVLFVRTNGTVRHREVAALTPEFARVVDSIGSL